MEHNAPPDMRKTKWTFSAIEAIFWMSMTLASFQVLFLESRGFDSVEVGRVMAIMSLIGVVMPSVWGIVSDRMGSVKRVILFLIVTMGALRLGIPIMGKLLPNMAWISVVLLLGMGLFQVGPAPLLDSWLMSLIERRGDLDYSSIRLWGSIGYAIAVALMTPLINWFSVDVIFVVCTLLSVPFLYLCIKQPDVSPAPVEIAKAAPEKTSPLTLFKNFGFVTLLIFSMLIYLPTTSVTLYISYMFKEIGQDASMLGVLIGLRTVMEAPGMILHSKLRKRYTAPAIMLLSAVLYVLEMFLYKYAQSVPFLMVLGALDGFSYGLLLPGLVSYSAQLAPESLRSTAQALSNTVCNNVAGVLLGLIGGPVIAQFGARRMYVSISLLALIAGVLFLSSQMWMRRRQQAKEF